MRDVPRVAPHPEAGELLARLTRGEHVPAEQILKSVQQRMESIAYRSFVPLLPLLSLKGKPYNLDRHFPMEPMFKTSLPRKMLWKCARQVSKSTSLSAGGVMRAAGTPYLQQLFVAPRFEQIRRLSANYIRPFIEHSFIKDLLINEECVKAVLQRSFVNQAAMFFSFAFIDVDRIRGLAVDLISVDEVQDLDYDFLPIILECMSASDFGVSFLSGTPKSLDNTIEALWQATSRAEWVTRCDACAHWNMAAAHADLLKMIGLRGVVCARCDKPINPRAGHWYHTAGKTHMDFQGFHVPQIIMPMHYENEEKWKELLAHRAGKDNYTSAKFSNEVLGESADMGIKLVSVTDIQKASKLGRNEIEVACEQIKHCKIRVMGVDWGGGGQEEVSFTAVSLVGLDVAHGVCECHYAERFSLGLSYDDEIRTILQYFRGAGCHYLAHDYGGSGALREAMLIQAGLPIDRVIGLSYTYSPSRHIVYYIPPVQNEMRGYYGLDKPRSLVMQALCVKSGLILLPEYESSKAVTHDLLALMEDKHEAPRGSDIYLIRRQPKLPDDFAHALNFACVGIWHTERRYPDLSLVQNVKMSQEQLNFAQPPTPDWDRPMSPQNGVY